EFPSLTPCRQSPYCPENQRQPRWHLMAPCQRKECRQKQAGQIWAVRQSLCQARSSAQGCRMQVDFAGRSLETKKQTLTNFGRRDWTGQKCLRLRMPVVPLRSGQTLLLLILRISNYQMRLAVVVVAVAGCRQILK